NLTDPPGIDYGAIPWASNPGLCCNHSTIACAACVVSISKRAGDLSSTPPEWENARVRPGPLQGFQRNDVAERLAGKKPTVGTSSAAAICKGPVEPARKRSAAHNDTAKASSPPAPL